jgi:uncharacterized protein (TIGR02266 family)
MEPAIPTFTPPRVPLDVEVDCATDQVTSTLNYQAMNLSEGGMFLKSPFPLEVGTCLTCRFELPDGLGAVVVEAEVSWVRTGPPENLPPPGMGLRFLSLKQDDKERIQQYATDYEEQADEVGEANDISVIESEEPQTASLPETLQGEQIGLKMSGMAAPVDAEVRAVSSTGLAVAAPLSFLGSGTVIELDGVDTVHAGPVRAKVLWSELEESGTGVPLVHMGLKLVDGTAPDVAAADVAAAESLPPPPPETVEASGFEKPPPPPAETAVQEEKQPDLPIEVNQLFGGVVDPPPPEPVTPWKTKTRFRDYSKLSSRSPSARRGSKPVSRTFITVVSCVALAGLGAAFAVVLSWSRAERKKKPAAKQAVKQSSKPVQPSEAGRPSGQPGAPTRSATAGRPNLAIAQPSQPLAPAGPPPVTVSTPDGKTLNLQAKGIEGLHPTPVAPPVKKPTGLRSWKKGRDFVIKLAAGASPRKVSHYWMLKPPALVVDLHGVRPEVKSGRYKVSHNSVRFIKVIRVRGRARFIVYFAKGSVPKEVAVQKSDTGGTLTLVKAVKATRKRSKRKVARRKAVKKARKNSQRASSTPMKPANRRVQAGAKPAKKPNRVSRVGFINRKPGWKKRRRRRKPQPRLTLAE